MKAFKQDFLDFVIAKEVLTFGEFELKSGRISPYFFNAGKFNEGKDLALLGGFYAQAIEDALTLQPFPIDVIFGPAYKGIPIATAVALTLYQRFDRNLPYCFNRKEAKKHGEGGNLVGSELRGDVLLVDDVITAGTAIRESVQLIKQHQATLATVVIALDRQEQGQDNRSAVQAVAEDYGCRVIPIVTLSEMLEYVEQSNRFEQATVDSIKAYRDQYGIVA